MVLTRFLPQNEQFYGHFHDAAANALEVAQLLNEVFEHHEDVERKVRRMHDLEHRGDEISHRIFSALNSTFVTPMDREDIAGLAAELDDFVDDMEEAGKRLSLYRLRRPTEPSRLLVRILVEQAELVEMAMGRLEQVGKNREMLRRHAVEIHRLENEADDTLNNALATLYEGVTEVPDLIQAIRWGELYGLLEDATDRAEDIGDRIEAIVAKYA
jgi:predicted phosphate transport protein (TIGR00153 family)